MSKEIPLTQGKVAIVDDEDFDWLSRWKWHIQKSRYTWYAVRCQYLGGGRKHQKSKMICMHREILKSPANMETDHRDGNGWNNQQHNLRVATKAQNMHNRRKQKSTSKFKGVYWCRRLAKWLAQIQVEGKQLYLGLFLSEIEAARAYDAAARKYFGEFARCNL